MPIRTAHLINTTLDDSPTSITGVHSFAGAAPKRATLQIQVVKTGSPTSVTLTVEVSPDEGASLISYDKLLDHSGTDAPVSSVAYTTTIDDIVSFSAEDVMKYVKVTMTGSGTDGAGNNFAVDVWLVYDY